MNAPLRLLESIRTPLAQARAALMIAEADLNGHITRLAAGHPVARETLRNANARVTHARHELDRVRLATLEVESIGNRRACTNDPDDMIDALITALERVEPRALADHAERLGPADCLHGARGW